MDLFFRGLPSEEAQPVPSKSGVAGFTSRPKSRQPGLHFPSSRADPGCPPRAPSRPAEVNLTCPQKQHDSPGFFPFFAGKYPLSIHVYCPFGPSSGKPPPPIVVSADKGIHCFLLLVCGF